MGRIRSALLEELALEGAKRQTQVFNVFFIIGQRIISDRIYTTLIKIDFFHDITLSFMHVSKLCPHVQDF